MLVLIHNVTNELQFIPARGRKPDELFSISFNCGLQFIPARGRKLLNHGLRSSHTEIAIYPREGTETN